MRLKFHSSDLLDPQNITLHIPLIDQIYEKMFYGLGGFIFLPKWKISKTVLFYMPWGTSKVILIFEIPKFAATLLNSFLFFCDTLKLYSRCLYSNTNIQPRPAPFTYQTSNNIYRIKHFLTVCRDFFVWTSTSWWATDFV